MYPTQTSMQPSLTETIGGGLGLRPERIDWMLLGCAAALIGLGIFFIASASGAGEGWGYAGRQAVFLAMGVAAFIAVQRADYLTMMRHAPLLYAGGLVLLMGVFFTRPINGARSWFDLYFFKLQPSEIMKPVLILTLAHYLIYRESYKRLTGLLVPLILCFIPMALILKQPDLGTTMVLVPVVFAMLYAAAARLWHLALMVLCGAGGLVGMWFTIMKDYQKNRILAWLYPEKYRLSEAWQQLQSQTAIGSGGFFGKGWGETSQGSLTLLPEKHTDFIFAVASEEGGFLIAALLTLLLCALAIQGLKIASRTREPAGRLIAVGVSALLGGQALINMGVALGLLPTTGVTMPFVSYGGSSLISSLICLGLLINVGAKQTIMLGRETFE
ncbi:MAG: rod shape-determining protein RodA [Planctomycetota bacterium]|nr:rod shape-determining protein RodA [Planctomycetota bacterium]